MTRHGLVLLLCGLAGVFGATGCAPDEADSPPDEREGAILNGTATSDGLGYAYVESGARTCSGTFLSSRWVLTAGHCLLGAGDGIANTVDLNGNPIAWVNAGNTTNSGTSTAEVVIHPRWWAKDAAGNSVWTQDPAFDIALLRVASPFSTVGYPHQLVSYPSAFPVSAGDVLECRGYGGTSTNGTGGGKGHLQKALLTVLNPTARPSTGISAQPNPTMDMVELATNSAGQQLFNGDSGGSCFFQGYPNHLVGINAYRLTATGTGLLVKLAAADNLTAWIDYVLYSQPVSQGLPFATPKPDFVSSVSTPSSNGVVTYVVAGYRNPPAGQSRLWMKAFSDRTAPTAWSPLSTTGLPAGAIASRVALGASSVSPGAPWLGMSVVGSDGNMYTAIFGSGFTPSTSWTGFSWTSAGKPAPGFLAGGQPAMAIMSTGGRFDLFALGADSKVYTRWNAGNTWRSSWMLLPGANNKTFAKGLNVAYDTVHQMFFLAAVGDGTTNNPNSGVPRGWLTSMSNVLLSTNYGNNWTAWEDMGGGFHSSMAVTSWLGALSLYAVGGDDHLYHANFLWDDGWTEWLDLGKGTFNGSYGVTASTNDGSATKINVVAVDPAQNPVLLTFPR